MKERIGKLKIAKCKLQIGSPGESYIIVSVASGKAEAVNSYTKPGYSEFEKEEIEVEG